jgi:hypothetical protein
MAEDRGVVVAVTGAGQATVGVASGLVAAANAARRSLVLTNDSDAAIYLGYGVAAVVGSGVRLNAAGGSVEVMPFAGAVYAIAGGANKNLCVVEV